MSKKRSSKVPKQYEALAKAGLRVRFNGFWLGESERDRTVADWIDSTPQAGTIIKQMIYSLVTRSGVFFTPRSHHDIDPIADYDDSAGGIGEAGSALLDLDD